MLIIDVVQAPDKYTSNLDQQILQKEMPLCTHQPGFYTASLRLCLQRKTNPRSSDWFTRLMSEKEIPEKHSRFGPETLPGVRNPSVMLLLSPIFPVTHEGAVTDSVSVALTPPMTMKISCAYHCLIKLWLI